MNRPSAVARPPIEELMTIDAQLDELRVRVESALDGFLPSVNAEPTRLHEAMRYSTLGGGKRVRALLVYGAGGVCDAALDALDPAACAVEIVHAYSLIHDDLPSMDDDALRRGKPTCHIAFDEATAILAGDALQALAFEVLSTSEAGATGANRLAQLETLATASGSSGMAGGQTLDLLATNKQLDIESLTNLHSLKTGALIRAAVRMGALCGSGVSTEKLGILDDYAAAIGLAFQVIDDILDEESDTETLGKTSGADREMGKSTFPALVGIEKSRRIAHALCDEAIASLKGLGDNSGILEGLAERIVTRIS